MNMIKTKRGLIGFLRNIGLKSWREYFEEQTSLQVELFLKEFNTLEELKAYFLEEETPDPFFVEREEMEEALEKDERRKEWYYQY